MFWNKPKPSEPKDKGSDTDTALNYSRTLALRIMDTIKKDKTKDDIAPEERVLHLMALQMAATIYIVHAPDPQLCLRNFVEVLGG
jgi:hypothetical protein